MQLVGRTILTIAVTAAAVASTACAQSVDLTPRLKAGHHVYVEMTQQGEQKISGEMVGPEEMTVTSGEIVGFFEKASSAASGTSFKIVFDRRGMNFNHPMMGKMEFDSDTGVGPSDDNSVSLICAPWLGKSLAFEMDVDGKAAKIEGFDKLLEAIEDSAMGDMFFEQTRAEINEEGLKEQFINARFAALPMKEVSAGDTWTRELAREHHMFGELVTRYACKLERIEEQEGRKVAVLSYTSETNPAEGAEPKANAMGMTPVVKSMVSKGTITVDVSNGYPVGQEAESTSEIDLQMASPSGEGTTSILVAIKSNSTVKTMTEAQRKAAKAANRKPQDG